MNPKISIVIPNYNSSKTIGECLEAATNIDYNNYEVIVVDDASTDNSVDIIKKFRCKLIKLNKNQGAAGARNMGARNAKGTIIMFTDSDIIIPRNALNEAIKFMKNTNSEIFFCSFKPKIRYKNFFSIYKHLYLCYYYEKQGSTMHTIDTSFAFIKKSIFDKFKGFNTNIRISEDVDLGVRLTGKGYKIHHSKNIQMEHLKKYTFTQFIKTDLIRSERMSKIFLSSLFGKRKAKKQSFYLKPINIYLGIPISSMALLATILAILLKSKIFTLAAILLYIIFTIVNLDYWSYLKRIEGWQFAFKATFINFLDMIVMNAGVIITCLNFIINKGDI